MVSLRHIDAEQFLLDSFRLGRKIFETGFRPKHAISIWRGGTPVGLGVDAYFRTQGQWVNHTTIATESYVGIDAQGQVVVKGLEHVVKVICPEDGLLILDDVYESGRTIQKIVETLRAQARANAPREIVVATLHAKPQRYQWHELPHIYIEELPGDMWIDYPHELADLYDPDDPDDSLIRDKDEEIWRIVRATKPFPEENIETDRPYEYVSARQLLHDALKLGVNIALDDTFVPDFLIALWPGGVSVGLPVHEVYKYFHQKRVKDRPPLDHVAINTTRSHLSYRVNVIGMRYLEERISRNHKILILDTTFRSGRMVNDVVIKLKEVLRRNLNENNIKVACVYYNPDDRSTWTVQPRIRKPNYYLKRINADVVYPQNVTRLVRPRRELAQLRPDIAQVIWGKSDEPDGIS
ncbi:MAG: hypothetical protein J7M25_17310 [Deltaproteobacteria bacterium]|nr:hypothetical protein [Deltaproteobacteria bacterium]